MATPTKVVYIPVSQTQTLSQPSPTFVTTTPVVAGPQPVFVPQPGFSQYHGPITTHGYNRPPGYTQHPGVYPQGGYPHPHPGYGQHPMPPSVVNKKKGSTFNYAPSYKGSIKIGGWGSKKKPSVKPPKSSSKKSPSAKPPKASSVKPPKGMSGSGKVKPTKPLPQTPAPSTGTSPSQKKFSCHMQKKERSQHYKLIAGPQVQVSDDISILFSSIKKDVKKEKKNRNLPSAYQRVLGEYEQESADSPLFVQNILLEAYSRGTGLQLDLEVDGNSQTTVSTVSPLLREETVTVDFPIKKMSISENEEFTVHIGKPGSAEKFSFTGVVHSNVPQNKVISRKSLDNIVYLPFSLYDNAQQESYKKNKIPTSHLVLVLRNTAAEAVFSIERVFVFLDLKPRRMSSTHAHIPGVPTTVSHIEGVNTNSVQTNEFDDRSFMAKVHQTLVEKFDSTAIVASSFAQKTTEDASFVHWGELTQTAVAFAVIHVLIANNNLKGLDDPEFLSKILSKDELGQELVNTLMTMSNSVTADENGVDIIRFPTLRQLLTHTSGIPSTPVATLEDVEKQYESAIQTLSDKTSDQQPASFVSSTSSSSSSSSSEHHVKARFSPENVYKSLETQFVEALNDHTSAPTLANATVGDWDNDSESCILAMFLHRYANFKHFPEEIINQVISSFDKSIQLKWGYAIDVSGKAVERPNNPYNLIAGISSSVENLIAFTAVIFSQLSHDKVGESATGIMLSNPIKVRKSSVVKHIAFEEETFDEFKVIYKGFTHTHLQSGLIFFIPMINFWGVVITNPSNDSFTQEDILNLVDAAIQDLDKSALPPVPYTLDTVRHGYLENAKYVKRADEVTVHDEINMNDVVSMGKVYQSPYTDFNMKSFTEIKLIPNEEYPHSRVTIETSSNGSAVSTFDVLLDVDRNAFFVIGADGIVGSEVQIRDDYVSFSNNEIYVNKEILEPLLDQYKKAVADIRRRAPTDIFNGAVTLIDKSIVKNVSRQALSQPVSGIDSNEGTLGSGIGVLGGLALGGLAVAGTAALASTAVNRNWYGRYSPWGMYPPPGYVGPYYGGPGMPLYPPDLWYGHGSPYAIYSPPGLSPSVYRYIPRGGYRHPWGPKHRPHWGSSHRLYGRHHGGSHGGSRGGRR